MTARNSRERRDYFYSQLIDILSQIRQLELPSLGSLLPDPSGGPDPIVAPLLSIPVNEMLVQCSDVAAPSMDQCNRQKGIINRKT